MATSPWGAIQTSRAYVTGFGFVSTAGHGGFYVTDTFASAHAISPEALAKAIHTNGRYWFEEDCDYTVLVWELPQYWSEIFTSRSDFEPRTYLLETLSQYHPDYLIARNVPPKPELYQKWLDRRERERREAARDPDLIVSASRNDDWETTHVWTADNREYDVTAASYQSIMKNNYPLLLLSDCVKVEPQAA